MVRTASVDEVANDDSTSGHSVAGRVWSLRSILPELVLKYPRFSSYVGARAGSVVSRTCEAPVRVASCSAGVR